MFNICFKLVMLFVYVKINDIFKFFSCFNFREKMSYKMLELYILICKMFVIKLNFKLFKF